MFAGTETANRAVQMYGFGFFEEKRGFWEARVSAAHGVA